MDLMAREELYVFTLAESWTSKSECWNVIGCDLRRADSDRTELN